MTRLYPRQPTVDELEGALLWLKMAIPVAECLAEKLRAGKPLDAVELAHWLKVMRGPVE